jgi:hypothetical protein
MERRETRRTFEKYLNAKRAAVSLSSSPIISHHQKHDDGTMYVHVSKIIVPSCAIATSHRTLALAIR